MWLLCWFPPSTSSGSLLPCVVCPRETEKHWGTLGLCFLSHRSLRDYRGEAPVKAPANTCKMLSVQSPGCAGMERLGGGAGAAGGGDVTGGGKGKRRDIDDLTLREVNMILEYRARRERCVQNAEHLNCPPHIALPDGEGGPDKHLQLRVNYQQSELTRSTVQPPPNKSVMDVPEWAAAVPMCPGGATHKPLSPQKKDGIVQKAVKYLVKIGGGKASPEGEQGAPTHHREERRAPCVMVPLTRPPPPPHPPPT